MRDLFRAFAEDETAATSIEYGLIAALISVVIIGTVTTLGGRLRTKFTAVSNNLQ